MRLNFIKGTIGSTQTVKVTERDFWRSYLFFLNLRTTAWINQKEIEILSWILANDPDVCYFSTPNNALIKKAVPKLSDAELSRIRKRLLELGLITEQEHDMDKRRKVTKLDAALSKFQKFVKGNNMITIEFPYEITKE